VFDSTNSDGADCPRQLIDIGRLEISGCRSPIRKAEPANHHNHDGPNSAQRSYADYQNLYCRTRARCVAPVIGSKLLLASLPKNTVPSSYLALQM
jgi:hypothetical protein